MSDYQFIFIFVLIMQIAVAGWQGYLTKKNANKADKEDIQELTTLVESVKSEFIRDNAKVQSDLDIIKDRRGKHYTQAQQAIINFYTDFNNLIYKIGAIYVPEDEPQAVNRLLAELYDLKCKVDTSINLMDLLINQPESMVHASNMMTNGTEIFGIAVRKLIDYKYIYNFYKALNDYRDKGNKILSTGKNIDDEITEYHNKLMAIPEALHDEVQVLLDALALHQVEFKVASKLFLEQ